MPRWTDGIQKGTNATETAALDRSTISPRGLINFGALRPRAKLDWPLELRMGFVIKNIRRTFQRRSGFYIRKHWTNSTLRSSRIQCFNYRGTIPRCRTTRLGCRKFEPSYSDPVLDLARLSGMKRDFTAVKHSPRECDDGGGLDCCSSHNASPRPRAKLKCGSEVAHPVRHASNSNKSETRVYDVSGLPNLHTARFLSGNDREVNSAFSPH